MRLLSTRNGALLVRMLVVVSLLAFAFSAQLTSAKDGADAPTLKGAMDGLFIENLGQWDAEVAFQTGGGGAEVWLAPTRMMYAVYDFEPYAPKFGDDGAPPLEEPEPDPDAVIADAHAVEVRFEGANRAVEITGQNEQPGLWNWIIGDREPVSGAKGYGQITYHDLWDGIDLVVEGSTDPDGMMKATFVVAPGADPQQIVLKYDGADPALVEENLVLATSVGDIVEGAPLGYTDLAQLTPVDVAYKVDGDQVRFGVGAFDAAKTLYIDPSVGFSRRFGGGYYDFANAAAEDALGYRYIGGFSYYTPSYPGIPGTPGAFKVTQQGYDWWAAKFTPMNDTLIYFTYIGSTTSEYGVDMELLPNGNLVLAGTTYGDASGSDCFPGPAGGCAGVPANTTATSSTGAAIFELSSDFSTCVRSAFWSGRSPQYLNVGGLARDPATGDYYVIGIAWSYCYLSPCGLGTDNGALQWRTYYGPPNPTYSYPDSFVTRLDSTMSTASAYTYLGGASSYLYYYSYDGLFDGVVKDGYLYLAGSTASTLWNFSPAPLVIGTAPGAYPNYANWLLAKLDKTTLGRGAAGYVVSMGGGGSEPYTSYSTSFLTGYYYGALSRDPIKVDASDQMVIAGMTTSTDYPTAGTPLEDSLQGGADLAVSVLNAAGTDVVESTYLGGSQYEYGGSVAIGPAGNIWVTASSYSSNYPVEQELQPTNKYYDAVISVFKGSSDLSELGGSTWWGGINFDWGAVIIPETGLPTQQWRARVVGDAYADWPQIPVGSPVLGTTGGYYDGFAMDINFGGAKLEYGDTLITSIPATHDLDCLTAGDFLWLGVEILSTGLSPQGDNPGPELVADLTGEASPILDVRTSTSGADLPPVCTFQDKHVECDFALASGETATIEVLTRVNGGVPAGSSICIEATMWFDVNDVGSNDSDPVETTACAETDCPPTVDPNRQLGKEVHLPILNFQGQDDVCRTWLEVQNIGPDFKKAILVTWGEPGFCPPQCAGPLKVECSGLLKPGSTWNFLGAQVPTGSKSGMLFQFTAKQLTEVGVDLGFDDIVADLMCETLFFGVVGDCDDYRRFKKAYIDGGDFGGIPMDDAVKGGGILAVEVLRHCPGDVTPGVEVSSKYGGIAGAHLGAWDEAFGGYAYYVPLLYADKAGFNSVMYIQNGGLECTSVEIWFKAQDDCLRARICEVFTLAPGESYQFDATDCVGPDWQGSAWLRSTQPLAMAVDIIGRDTLMTYIGEPAQLNYTFDPNQAAFSQGNQVLYGPLVYSEYQGWDSGIQVQNLSSVTAAKVKVYFLDRSGDVITTLVDWICPRGSQTFFLPVVHKMPGNWVGALRAESQNWWTPGDPEVEAPYIVGVATLIKYVDAARTDALEAIAYNLLPEHKAYDWQIGFGGGSLDSGVGLIAIPSLLKDLDATGVTSEIAIANLVPKPGFTDFAIYIYDQNGLLDFVCQKLNEKQVEYIDVQSWGYINPGFKGSAVIAATFWEHEVFDDTGFFLRNLVGLAAVSVERTGTSLGEDVPGDEAAGMRGIPFEERDQFTFDWEGPTVPICPGQPVQGPPPCPTVNVQGRGGLPIDPPETQSDTVTVNVPDGCVVVDVNVDLEIQHTWMSDLQVSLDGPGASGQLFGGICGSTQDFGPTTVDDSSSNPVTAACGNTIPDVRTQSGTGLDGSFPGTAASGDWTLTVTDTWPGLDSGQIEAWGLTIVTERP